MYFNFKYFQFRLSIILAIFVLIGTFSQAFGKLKKKMSFFILNFISLIIKIFLKAEQNHVNHPSGSRHWTGSRRHSGRTTQHA